MSAIFPYSFGIHNGEVRIDKTGEQQYNFEIALTDGTTDNFIIDADQLNNLHGCEEGSARAEAVKGLRILLEQKAGE